MNGSPVLSVRDLAVTLPGRNGPVHAVRGLSFDVGPGEALAVVGESGAGKSVTARTVLGMAPFGARISGSATVGGQEVVGASAAGLRALRGRRATLIPQDALAVLSPVHTVGAQIAAALRSVRRTGRAQARREAVAALGRVGIPDPERAARRYPHEFSGGMRQRAVIAMATAGEPDLVFADEPTTALDPVTREHVLDLLQEMRERTGAALVLITHDPAGAGARTDRMLVMYAGRHVESGPSAEVLGAPRAPYTAGLLASLPERAPSATGPLPVIPGAPPVPGRPPAGCAFEPRCPLASDPCRSDPPDPAPVPGARDRLVSCHRRADVPEPPSALFADAAPGREPAGA
ncbi:ABC transporter ATP-binding protein [Nocardiopsis chromatogenes]|uniref:ABC transporter ATP-binding protein n=1 Tax=Nocardiopsis chromatogenes TaxID=280239 RepID=UPI0003469CDF|nr:ABC transporter ATP-binding protein [Nocardiopsis chromatogenes]